MASSELERLYRQYLQYAERLGYAEELEKIKEQLLTARGCIEDLDQTTQSQSAIVRQVLELRRIWQGPGQHSHELRAAMLDLFALLPEEPGLSVHVTDSLAMKGKVGG